MKVINNKVNKIYDSDCLLHHWCWDRLDPKPKISTEQLDVDLLTLEGKRNVQEQVVVNVNYKPYVIWDATLQEAEHQKTQGKEDQRAGGTKGPEDRRTRAPEDRKCLKRNCLETEIARKFKGHRARF